MGRALALDLAARGWRVAAHDQSEEAAEVVQAIEELGGEAAVLCANLSKAADTRSLVANCVARFGAPDCLINNASLCEDGTLATLDEAGWGRHMDINMRAPVFLARDFAAALPAGRHGVIINIITESILPPGSRFSSCRASKSGLWAVTDAMALALAPRIRVNAISHGPERGASAGDVVAAARFILDAKAMTGQMIALDGGRPVGRT
jgi:NAD(P)-dependent dehydrogenase (short-subunit alcohol dehydrogenase family)